MFLLKPAGSSDCCNDRLGKFFGVRGEYLSISMQKNLSAPDEMGHKIVVLRG